MALFSGSALVVDYKWKAGCLIERCCSEGMALPFVNKFCLTDYMFRIALQIGLTVTAFLITASLSLAAECADDPNDCTPKKLCEIATDT